MFVVYYLNYLKLITKVIIVYKFLLLYFFLYLEIFDLNFIIFNYLKKIFDHLLLVKFIKVIIIILNGFVRLFHQFFIFIYKFDYFKMYYYSKIDYLLYKL